MAMRIILTRHGETEENKMGIIQGHLPGVLSLSGIEQARKLANRLKGEKIDRIFSSDLARAVDTAKEIVRFHKDVSLEFNEELRERFFGELEGLSKEKDLGIPDGKSVEDFVVSENSESIKELFNRARDFLDFLKDKFEGKCVLLVGHDKINRAIVANLIGKSFEDLSNIERQKNTAVSVFNIWDSVEVVVFNCVKHLEVGN